MPFSTKPSSFRWYQSFTSYERNGILNLALSRNWVRVVFPLVPVFYMVYMMQPVIHGHTYVMHYNNYQWESIYFKYGGNRPVYTDNTITRLA